MQQQELIKSLQKEKAKRRRRINSKKDKRNDSKAHLFYKYADNIRCVQYREAIHE
tara:strand:+ start:251 stop:415 length:165 start_codon:yes stop_codon:yes gene_type:complete